MVLPEFTSFLSTLQNYHCYGLRSYHPLASVSLPHVFVSLKTSDLTLHASLLCKIKNIISLFFPFSYFFAQHCFYSIGNLYQHCSQFHFKLSAMYMLVPISWVTHGKYLLHTERIDSQNSALNSFPN